MSGDYLNPAPGSSLELRRLEDVDGDTNRGWRRDILSAWVNGEIAGYLALSWIPRARFNQHYSRGMIDFAIKVAGHANLRTTDSYIEAIKASQWHRNRAMTDAQAEQWLNKTFAEPFADFKRFHVDRPLVDYVYTFRTVDTELHDWFTNKKFRRNTKVSYRSVGLGIVLYEQAAIWAAERRQTLFASGLQTNEAKRAWEQIIRTHENAIGRTRAGKTNGGKIRTTLNGAKITPSFPNWVSDVKNTIQVRVKAKDAAHA